MMNILSKNDSSKNNHAYSIDALRGMCDQLSSLEKPILASVQHERPGTNKVHGINIGGLHQ